MISFRHINAPQLAKNYVYTNIGIYQSKWYVPLFKYMHLCNIEIYVCIY